jgi:hypothetical protein
MTTFGSLSSGEVCEQTGATYRQLDYWARAGIIRPEAHTDHHGRPAEGSGTRRWWLRSQLPTIRALVALSDTTTGTGNHPSQILRAVGRSPNPRGPWILEQDGVRITVQLTSRQRTAS